MQQANDPCDSTLNSEFRTQRQTEYLLEAFHLQHRAAETRQKLSTVQAETAKSSFGDELPAEAKVSTRRALSSARNNFKEIQRSLEIWLARILGDLEGMLARDGASRIREYILSPYASAVRWVRLLLIWLPFIDVCTTMRHHRQVSYRLQIQHVKPSDSLCS